MTCTDCKIDMKQFDLGGWNPYGLQAAVKHEWKDTKYSAIENYACPKCGRITFRLADTKILG